MFFYSKSIFSSDAFFDPEFFLADTDGNEHTFAIADFATAEARRQGRENELIPGSIQEAVIELGSGVVCVFDDTYLFEHPEFGTFLGAMQFVIE